MPQNFPVRKKAKQTKIHLAWIGYAFFVGAGIYGSGSVFQKDFNDNAVEALFKLSRIMTTTRASQISYLPNNILQNWESNSGFRWMAVPQFSFSDGPYAKKVSNGCVDINLKPAGIDTLNLFRKAWLALLGRGIEITYCLRENKSGYVLRDLGY